MFLVNVYTCYVFIVVLKGKLSLSLSASCTFTLYPIIVILCLFALDRSYSTSLALVANRTAPLVATLLNCSNNVFAEIMYQLNKKGHLPFNDLS